MSTELTTVESASLPSTITPSDDQHMLIIAENPGEMDGAQAALRQWFDAKVKSISADLDQARGSLDVATRQGWELKGFKSVVGKLERELTYYEKCAAAVAQGYCIVPDFPVDLVAVRTSREFPSANLSQSNWRTAQQSCQPNLPAGEGVYVSPEATVGVSHTEIEKDYQGKDREVKIFEAVEFKDVAFPVKFMKPQVLEASHRAMGLQLFDQIGVLPARRKSDPIVVGRILGPKKSLTFLIAWFIDTKDL